MRTRAMAMFALLAAVAVLSAGWTQPYVSPRPGSGPGRGLGRGGRELHEGVQDAPSKPEIKIELERASRPRPRVHFERAARAEQTGELEEAIAEYRKTIEYQPGNRQAAHQAAELERIVRDRAEASRPRPGIDQLKERARKRRRSPRC